MSKEMELRQQKAALVKAGRDMLNVLDEEKRNEFTAEENERYERIEQEIEQIEERIQKEVKQSKLDESITKILEAGPRPQPENRGEGERETAEEAKKAEVREAFRKVLSATDPGEYYSAMAEARALQVDKPTAGGYTVVPEQFIAQLIKDLDNEVFIRRFATVYAVPNAVSIGVPALDTDIEDATWSGEISTRDEDTAMAFGKRELTPHSCNKLIKVSKKHIRASALDIERLVRERMTYKFGVTEENAFLNGTGAGQPLGVFTASNDGISTSYDVSTGNTSTDIRFDGLIEAKYKIKSGYLNRAIWIFHRDGVKRIRKLKDGEGQFIWQQSMQVGQPDRILGLPVYMSEYAPNTFSASQYVGIIGDFKYYWIVDALDMQVQVLVEKYADTNRNGYVGLKETDGMPVLENAFARVKLGA